MNFSVKQLQMSVNLELFFVAQDRQANGCLHTNSFAGRKNMEHEVRNVRVRNRVGVSLLDFMINILLEKVDKIQADQIERVSKETIR